ncbi:MAG TPA: metallophosphoesterase, partial [Flavisolibacter sp.]|nr:metallophosphoesterase [Flavisolibacter sp.]
VLLLTGDIIDQTGELTPAKHFFGLLAQHITTLAIAGNHDHKNKVSIGALKKLLMKNRGYLLINETKQVTINGITLTITGVDDFIEGNPNLGQSLQSIGKEDHHLLLVHSPLQQELVQKGLQIINTNRAETDQVNLQYIFAGHNHGGQVRLGPFVPVLPEKSGSYIDGWYNEHKPYLYVSKGFGTSGVPFRFGARAEIVLFHYGV